MADPLLDITPKVHFQQEIHSSHHIQIVLIIFTVSLRDLRQKDLVVEQQILVIEMIQVPAITEVVEVNLTGPSVKTAEDLIHPERILWLQQLVKK